jgi:5-methylcytosine-specific restriction endonuclease McrBC regulatory subunit McrC
LRASPQNIFLMLAYAWRHLDAELLDEVGKADAGDWAELLAILLAESSERALRVGPPCAYQMEEVNLRGIRGRIDMPRFAQARARGDSRFPCVADLLTVDCSTNRLIKAAALMLARSPSIRSQTASRLLRVTELLREVAVPTNAAMLRPSMGRPHRNGAHALAAFVAELVINQEAPTANEDLSAVVGWPKSPQALGALFQDFLTEYWRDTSRLGQRVAAHQRYELDAAPTTRELADLLPVLRTDITLFQPGRLAVVEAKYMSPLIANSRWGEDKPRFRSDHIAQLLCYLVHARIRSPSDTLLGALIYPQDSVFLRARFRIHDYEMCVATVNLHAPWQTVLGELSLIRDGLESAKPLGLSVGESVALRQDRTSDDGGAAPPLPPTSAVGILATAAS